MQSKFIAASLFALLCSSSAIKLVDYSVHNGMVVDLSEPITFEWESVETDPETFGIELINMHVYPPIKTKVTSDIHTDDGSYIVWNTEHIDPSYYGRGFQFNLVSETRGNTGILTQSGQFSAQRSRAMLATPTPKVSSTAKSTTTTTTTTSSTTIELEEALIETTSPTSTETAIDIESSGLPSTLVSIPATTVTEVSPGYANKIGTNTPVPESGSGGSSVTSACARAAGLVAVAFAVFF